MGITGVTRSMVKSPVRLLAYHTIGEKSCQAVSFDKTEAFLFSIETMIVIDWDSKKIALTVEDSKGEGYS